MSDVLTCVDLAQMSKEEREQQMEADGWERTSRGWRKVYGSGDGKTPRRTGDQNWTEHTVCLGMSIKPEEATPERIARENAAARYHGTGAYYTPDGKCHTPTRRSQGRELRRREMANFDAGFGDWAGR